MSDSISGLWASAEELWAPVAFLAAVSGVGFGLGRFGRDRAHEAIIAARQSELTALQKALDTARGQLAGAMQGVSQPARLWQDPFEPSDLELFNSIARNRVIAIANLKGGVGKSTVAASLAAYFASKLGKRTLLVDLDFQSTVTVMARRQAGMQAVGGRVSSVLGAAELTAEHFALPVELGSRAPNLWVLGSDETLDAVENGLMIKAVLRQAGQRDIRLALARYLRSQQMVDRFEVVILDTPPRFSAAAVNGVLAATHVLIPSKLEDSSVEATINYAIKLRRLQQQGYPVTNFVGVLPVMTQTRPALAPNELAACNLMDDQLAQWYGQSQCVIRGAWVPDRVDIGAAAARGIAYLQSNDARAIFDDVGEAIRARIY